MDDGTLPDAPGVFTAKAGSSDTSAPAWPLALAADARSFDEGRVRLKPFSQEESLAARPWLTGAADVYERGNGSPAQGVHINIDALMARMNRPSGENAEAGVGGADLAPRAERYHWKGLLWESFAFFGVENTQRLLSDPYFRYLTADRPFWHDYIASLKHWNWRRWDDGDDFLVAYVAHPLQGSVTEFIEIQNDPRGRELRIDDGRPYWRSQFHAFLWATAYSFDQKLGPLGEAALGSEGGYNYVIGCPYPCPAYNANPSQFKVTNNTGWVKLVSTPVVGTVWTLMEDGLDRWISDRVQDDNLHANFPKVLRGALNPARTMANLMRWRVPWYRDFQHDATNVYLTPAPHFLPGDDAVILAVPHSEVFPHFNSISLPVNTASCLPCREMTKGYGLELATRMATYADLDADVDYQPNASPLPSDRAGGNIIMGTFGLRSGYTNKYFSLKAFLRPGLLSYDRAYQSSPSSTNPTPAIGRITHFATALGVEGDVTINRRLALRGVVGNTAVRYREPNVAGPLPGTYPYLNWLSKLFFLTNENWNYQTGVVARF